MVNLSSSFHYFNNVGFYQVLPVLFYFFLNLISFLGFHLFNVSYRNFYFELVMLKVWIDNELVSLVEFFVIGRLLDDLHYNERDEVAF